MPHWVVSQVPDETLGRLYQVVFQLFREMESAGHGSPQICRETETLVAPFVGAFVQLASFDNGGEGGCDQSYAHALEREQGQS